MKLRVLRKNVFVPASTMGGGWKNSFKNVDRTKDVLQQWEDKEGWVDVPVQTESIHVYKDNMEIYN